MCKLLVCSNLDLYYKLIIRSDNVTKSSFISKRPCLYYSYTIINIHIAKPGNRSHNDSLCIKIETNARGSVQGG